jgi:hypothetical protein
MAPIVATVEVDRAAPEVFTFATDPSPFREWQKGVVGGHLQHQQAPAVGAKRPPPASHAHRPAAGLGPARHR